MSRKAINILFIVGSCLYIPGIVLIIWAYIPLLQSFMQSPVPGAYTVASFNGLNPFTGFLGIGALMLNIGGIALLVAEIGALIELAKAKEWAWFVLIIVFGWIVLLIYLIAGPKAEPVPAPAPGYAGYPYPYQPGQGYYPPQAPGTPPPAQPWQPPVGRQDMPEKPLVE